MKNTLLALTATVLTLSAATLSALTPALANETKKREWSQVELEGFMADFLMNNPKILLDSVDNFAKAQASQADERAQELVRQNADNLFANDALPEAGNPKGDVTIVEFLDYNCGYCKKAMADVMTLIGEDKNVRLLMVDIPILGPSSTEAAKWALAAKLQGRYLDYHVALMEHSGRLSEPQLMMIADRIGLDTDQLRRDKDSDEVTKMINDNIDLARRLSITGTPAFIVGKDLVRGYVGLPALKQGVAAAREDG